MIGVLFTFRTPAGQALHNILLYGHCNCLYLMHLPRLVIKQLNVVVFGVTQQQLSGGEAVLGISATDYLNSLSVLITRWCHIAKPYGHYVQQHPGDI